MDLYTRHPDIYLVTTCLKYGPVRDVFEAAALATVGSRAAPAAGAVAWQRPAAPASWRVARNGAPEPLSPVEWLRLWNDFLERLRTDLAENSLAEWTHNYGRGRAQQPWQWLVRWGVLSLARHSAQPRRRDELLLGSTKYRNALPLKAPATFMEGVSRMVGAVWSCQTRPPATERPEPPGASVRGCSRGFRRRWARESRLRRHARGQPLPRTGRSACKSCSRRPEAVSCPSPP